MRIDPTILLVSATVLPSCVLAWTAALMIRRFAPRLGLLDQPGHRKVHKDPTPLGGGVAIWLGVVLTFAVGHLCLWSMTSDNQPLAAHSIAAKIGPDYVQHVPGVKRQIPRLWAILGLGTILMIVGLADDRWSVDWRIRLAIQLFVAGVCVFWQGWQLTAFIGIWLLPSLLSIVWIAAMINSFNMLDNMDGLSAGVAAIAAAMLAMVMLLTQDPESGDPQFFVGGFLLVVTGALLGYLLHNLPPARIFMGDAGSYFVGFCIAIATLLATYTGYQSEKRHAVLAPLCVMAVPLYDMLSVLWIRFREGRSPFQADKSHFSHRLVDLGLSKGQAVLTIYLLTATCGLGALLLHRVDSIGAGIIMLMILCVLFLIAILESTALRRIKK